MPANTVMPEFLLNLRQEHRIYRGPLCRNRITKSGVKFESAQQEERD